MHQSERLLKDYLKQLSAVRKAVADVEERASKVQGQQQAYDDAQERSEALQDGARELRQEREALKSEYASALFENDTAEQERITSRRSQIDTELEALHADIAAVGDAVDEPDPDELATIAATKDSLKLPSYRTLLDQLESVLEAEKNEVRKSISGIKVPAGMDREVYESTRAELDPIYRSEQSWLRGVSEKYEAETERRERFAGVAGNTDAMAHALGPKARVQEPPMRVTHDGSRVSMFGDMSDD